MLWLLASGRPLGEVAAVTGYSTRWVREVVRRYNAEGAAGLADRRHQNAGAAPLLDAAGRAALARAVAEEAPLGGGCWTAAKDETRRVSSWIAAHLGRERVPVQRGWVYLKRTGHSRQRPRPQHSKAADPAAQTAFQQSSPRS